MTDKEVCRYIDLVDRRVFIISHSGVDWKPEYAAELEAIDRELAELRRKVDREHGRKEEDMKEYRVRFWHQDEDGRQDSMEFGTREEAQAFYNSVSGQAEIQQYVDRLHAYEMVVAPAFEV